LRLRSLALGLVGGLALVAACTSMSGNRIAPDILSGERPWPARVSVLPLDFGMGSSKRDGVLARDDAWSAKALEHLRQVAAGLGGRLPGSQVIDAPTPSGDALVSLGQLIERALRTTFAHSVAPDADEPTIVDTLGPGLAAWGTEHDVDALLVLRGEAVMPHELLSGFHDDDDGDFNRSSGFVQFVAVLLDTASGQVLWMDVRSELSGGGLPQPDPDPRKRYVVQDGVDELLANWPGERFTAPADSSTTDD